MLKMKTKTEQFNFLINSEYKKRLQEIADGRSVTYMINTAIKEYLSKFEDSSNDK